MDKNNLLPLKGPSILKQWLNQKIKIKTRTTQGRADSESETGNVPDEPGISILSDMTAGSHQGLPGFYQKDSCANMKKFSWIKDGVT